MAEPIERLMLNVWNEQDTVDCIQEMEIILGNLTSSELKLASQDVRLDVLFDRLNTSNSDQIIGICDILRIVFPVIDDALQNNARHIILALGHPETIIKETLLSLFIQLYDEKGFIKISGFIGTTQFLIRLIECLGDKETSVGLKAANIITKIGKERNGVKVLFSNNEVVEKMKQICEEDETVKIRVYQVLCDIGASSHEAFLNIEMLSLYRDLFNYLDTGDILASLAILEVLAPLALTLHGYDYMYKHDCLNSIIHELENIEANTIGPLILPGIAQFFGRLAKAFPVMFQKHYPKVVPALLKALDMEDTTSFVAALEVLGIIAYSHEGKLLFGQQDKGLMNHVILRIKDALTALPVHWRGRILTAIANLLHIDLSSFNVKIKLDEHLANIELSKQWFNTMGGDKFLETIFELVKQPFPDVKLAAYSVLKTISALSWGQTLIGKNTALIEFLLEKRNDPGNEEKEAKFSVVKTLAESPYSKISLGDYYNKLHAFVNHTDNGSALQMEVAVEGAD